MTTTASPDPILDPTRGTSEPSRYWTTTNMGEAVPDVLSPMCWDIWGEPAELGWLHSMYAFGVLPARKVKASPDINDWGLSVFYGRLAINVDAVRATVATLPGVEGDDFEKDLCGSVREDAPPVKGQTSRTPVILAKAPVTLLRQRRRITSLYDETYRWWQAEVLGDGSDAPAVVRLVAAKDRFRTTFKHHCVTRFMFSGAQTAVAGAAQNVGEAALATALISGVGGVFETRMADDLWRLAHDEIDETTFLRSWGYHGPNEGNPSARVWREEPAPVRALARAYADRGTERPRDREQRAVQASAEAEQRLLAATPAAKRRSVRFLLRKVRNVVRTLQVGKASYLMSIDGVRRATRDFGVDQVAAGTLREVDDAFYLSVEECLALDAGRLAGPQELVDRRRALREEYRRLRLPVFFRGMPEPERALEPVEGSGPRTVELSGSASGGGAVEGRARVLLDVNDDIDLEDGDILVCRFTDPSWAPLMSLSDALVIDIGGSASHGAVVARELGIPYVIGTERGTSLLRDGDRILVDGTSNLVRLLP